MNARRLVTLAALGTLMVVPLAGTAGAAGNSGTVKIFDGDKNLPANDPKVGCSFTVVGINFDAGEAVDVTIVGHGGEAGAGTYTAVATTDGQGSFQTAAIGLTDGTYKLHADDGEGGGDKNKVFKVSCDSGPGPI
jgi:hypothetical protein